MTTPRAMATLTPIGFEPTNPKELAPPIQVQFNPNTLKLQMANSVDMKKAFGARPVTQYDGTSSSTLSFDLIFDTADEGSTEAPVDVRTRTRPLEQFVVPSKPATGAKKSIPPRVRFRYESFELVGVVTALNQDFDLFSASGVPLRAKVAVTIKEQTPEIEANWTGAGANTGTGARDDFGLLPGGSPGGAPGRGGPPERTAAALAGESAADFANRVGLDPAAWRSLDLGGLDPLTLSAGASIGFSAGLSLELGLAAGVEVGSSTADPVLPAGAAPDRRAITAAGGVQQAVEADASGRSARAADAERAAFAPSAGTAVGRTGGSSAGLGPRAGAQRPARVTRPVADRRAVTYGTGVPLRPTVGTGEPAAPLPLGNPRRSVGQRAAGDVPLTDDPTVPGWQALRSRPQDR